MSHLKGCFGPSSLKVLPCHICQNIQYYKSRDPLGSDFQTEEIDGQWTDKVFHDIFTNEKTSQCSFKCLPSCSQMNIAVTDKSFFFKCSPSFAQMNISVMDNGANLVGFLRMDGAWLGSVDIAMKKVRVKNLENVIHMYIYICISVDIAVTKVRVSKS